MGKKHSSVGTVQYEMEIYETSMFVCEYARVYIYIHIYIYMCVCVCVI
jgi:hypothetical protein